MLGFPFPAGLSGTRVTCLGHHLAGQSNCSLTPEAPSGLSLSLQTYNDSKDTVAVELHCQGTFNPMEISWFRDRQPLGSPVGRYRFSPDGTRLTIWNFTAPQDLGDYDAICSNPLGSQRPNIILRGPSVSNWTLARGPNPGSAHGTWTVPYGSVVTSFWIQWQSPGRHRSAGEWETLKVLNDTSQSITIDGLQSQATYSVRVMPWLGSQAGEPSPTQTLWPVSHLDPGAIAGIVIGSILGMLLLLALLVLLVCCLRRGKNKKVPPSPAEAKQHYLSRQFPNGKQSEAADLSWGNPRWSSSDSNIYSITYEEHLRKHGTPATLPIDSRDGRSSGVSSLVSQPGAKKVRSATRV
uniref:Fibronectin type-III domain-containing protein n=1 Tax=Sphenodon punctatus TaxID=8508 RepID=A0A8D0LAR9_SPHPU